MRNWNFPKVLIEDAVAANVTGSPSSSVMSMPSDSRPGPVLRRWKKFQVANETFMKFSPGLSEWKSLLSPTVTEEKAILEFLQGFPSDVVVLENRDIGTLRALIP